MDRPPSPHPKEFAKEPPLHLIALVLGSIAASRFLAIAHSGSEIDEPIFAGALTLFDMYQVSPQAPGYPVFIWLGQLLRPLAGDAYAAFTIGATFSSVVAFPALFLWFRNLVGGFSALSGVLLAAVLPVVWVNGGRAYTDTPAAASFFLALGLLFLIPETRPDPGESAEERSSRDSWLALSAGLLAAAGAGVRPHLALAFAGVFCLLAWRLVRRGRPAIAATFVLSGLVGTGVWFSWLLAHASSWASFKRLLAERSDFRSTALATGTLGSLPDWFVVRDFLFPWAAILIWSLALLGLGHLVWRRRPAALDVALFLLPAFYSFWFWHSRAMIRYSVPLAMVVCVVAAYGALVLLRKPWLMFASMAGLSLFLGRWGLVAARHSATVPTPPAAAVSALSVYAHPGRETIIADDVFQAFLRTERWEGRLGAWGYLDTEWVAGAKQFNKRLVRMTDLTLEPPSAYQDDLAWRIFADSTWVARNLGNKRMLVVGVRDPAPPVFGPGFGVREIESGKPTFRWSGPRAHLFVPGLAGPPAALLHGLRPAEGGPATLTVTEPLSGRVVISERIEPGDFELLISDRLYHGPLPGPAEFVISCDAVIKLPEMLGAVRPREGCFVFREITWSGPAESLWDRMGDSEFRIDIGTPQDGRGGLTGFFGREEIGDTGVNKRWSRAEASVLWIPQTAFVPARLSIRAHAPSSSPVVVKVKVGEIEAGSLEVKPAPISESTLELPPAAAASMTGAHPVRISFSSPVFVPAKAGLGEDTRELGIAIDQIRVR
ncbi:MAG: hypothetical protein IT186_23940 [Acidobacteria bacterium]|nr:hypothetical protein [Acidobacteriota bacterium]